MIVQPQCLQYARVAQEFGNLSYDVTKNVYPLMPSESIHSVFSQVPSAFLMHSLGMSALYRDSDCLFIDGIKTVYFVHS